jgi:hypothetical protein
MIQMYEKILPESFCNYMIEKFESEKDNVDKSHDMFDQLEIDHWKDETKDLIGLTKGIAEHYSKHYDALNMMPKRRRIEAYRIKRYEPNKQCFPLHVDAVSVESCTRYLAFLFYLNDSEAGTKFHTPNGTEDLTFEAKQGNILVFPPMWMFPHEGLMPTEKPKYIMSTYFHYV